MQELKVVKKQLVLDLDKNEAPTAWRWRVDRFVKFGDGSEKIVSDEIPAAADEVKAHIGTAVGRQAADIENDRRERETAIADLTAKCASDLAEAKTAADTAARQVAETLAAARTKAAEDLADRDVQISKAQQAISDLEARLNEAAAKLNRIAQANAQYDENVRPLFEAVQ